MRRHRIVVTLSTQVFKQLSDAADRDERVVDQQATFLLRRALATVSTESTPKEGGEA